MFNLVKNLFSNLSVQASIFSLAVNTAIFATMAISLPIPFSSPATTPASAPTPAITVETPKTLEPPKTKYVEVIDVASSIRSWNEEAWCRTYWNKGVKCWFKDRQTEMPTKAKAIAEAFNNVWGDSPIHVQKLALSICLKETGCGFSEQRSYRKRGNKVTNKNGTRIWKATKFMSSREACGITQVDTRDNIGKVKCSILNESYENAFKWQKIWLEEYWNDGHKVKPTKVNLYGLEWLKPYKMNEDETTYLVWRYNGGGKTAWEYGRITMNIYRNHIVVQKVKVK